MYIVIYHNIIIYATLALYYVLHIISLYKTTQVRVVVCRDKTGESVVTQNEW